MLAVGDWTRTAAPATLGRVLLSLTTSGQPVTTIITRLNGVEQDRLTGGDLRKVAGVYMQLPPVRGSYSLSVEARDADGCSAGADRPMTVVVK